MNLNKKDILSIYNYFKKSALKALNKGDNELSLKQVEICAQLAYQFNYFYKDQDLEEILALNSQKINSGLYYNQLKIKGRYALIDTNGSDNHGLTQQYIRALIAAEVEFAYIYEDTDLSRINIILKELKEYPKATVFTFDDEYSYVKKSQMILGFLSKYNPEKFLMHIMPWDVVAVVVCNQLKGVIRYNINATDHAFWLGSSSIEYNIEFRDYGYTVSLDKRGLNAEQLLLLPYYPVFNRIPFKGFPKTILDKSVKIFSGGSFYKIYGDNGLYFDIIKKLLIDNPNAVFLYAGSGKQTKMERFIIDNDLKDRVYLLGNRSDIYEVFKECDIYLSTYPISGGLMSQYAAVNGKPILSYTSPNLSLNYVEGLVCHESSLKITYENLEDFYSYGRKLCSSESFRASKGLELKNIVISPEIFNTELKYLLSHNRSKRILNYQNINYETVSNLYLEVENKFEPSAQKLIALRLKFNIIFFPKILINMAIIVFKKLLNV